MSMGRDGSLKQTTPSPLQIAMPIWRILTGARLLKTAHSNLGSHAVTRASHILRIDRLDDCYSSAAWMHTHGARDGNAARMHTRGGRDGSEAWMHTRGVGDGMDAYSRFSRWCRCARLGATAGREVGAADGASVGVAATASSGREAVKGGAAGGVSVGVAVTASSGRVATTGAAGSGGSTVGSSR